MASVHVIGITKRLGRTVAVDDLSLPVEEGSFTTLLGPSGCGKTTLLRIIAGFYKPDHGQVLIGGRVVNDVPPYRRNTAMVFQEYALFPHMTVAENVGYGLRKRGVDPKQAQERVAEVLRLVDLHGQDHKAPHQLSGGQQQRVALARALAVDPAVLLLDEPLSNLDAKLRVRVRAELRQLQRAIGKTTLYVTHDQEEALAISDTVAVMNRGRIVQRGSPTEVYYHPRSAFVADFVGVANFLTGMVRGGAMDADGMPVQLGPGASAEGRVVTAVFRPEAARLSATSTGGPNVFHGRIVDRIFQGPIARYWVQVRQATWIIDVHDPQAQVSGDSVNVTIPAERLHILED